MLNRVHLLSSSLIVLVWMCIQHGATAQIVPDNTLPVGERSQISGNPTIQIDGGATRGSNLFHSFQQFSLPTGSTAFFNNAPNIQNILTRVTGGSISSIDGVIKANATANLFLLNPNGILFGPNARLNIGGSFVASTADSINFADGTLFSTKTPQTTPLLTINVPIGLQLGQNPGAITVQGSGYNLSTNNVPKPNPIDRGSSLAGLRVSSGKTLALVGGGVNIEGGTLTAEQGRIELGSVREGQVNLNFPASGLVLSYQGGQSFGDIRLSQKALVDASGAGVVQAQGNRVVLTDASIMLVQNRNGEQGGSININATQSLELSARNPDSLDLGGLRTETAGTGKGADIAVLTQQLVVQDGARISSYSYNSGKSGNVTVNASDFVQVVNFAPVLPQQNSSITAISFGSGGSGNITVATERLTLLNGGVVSAYTLSTGKGGDVTVNATESVEVIGANQAGINISGVSAFSGGDGDAGNVNISTSKLVARDGGAISAATYLGGRGGSVTINATKSVEVSGDAQLSALVPSQVSASATFFPFPGRPRPSGTSGDVTINTSTLRVTDGAEVSVSHQGTGKAGELKINASSIFLDRGGATTAATASGQGGNINLQVRDLLLLRHNGGVTATAGGTGNGGNINIDTPLLVAVPKENSDISANSVNFRGGNVTINTQGIFGIQFRDQGTPLSSDITATGRDSSLNGTVQINIDRVDPTSGLVELPTTVVDISRLIAQGCPANRGSSFVISGRGGLPQAPQQALSDDVGWRDWRNLAFASRTPSARQNRTLPAAHRQKSTHAVTFAPLVEATGWVINDQGQVVLIARAPTATPESLRSTSTPCPAPNSKS